MGTCARVMLAARVAMRSVSAGWAHMHILVMLVARVVMVIRHAVCPGARGMGALWSGGATLARSWRRWLSVTWRSSLGCVATRSWYLNPIVIRSKSLDEG